MGARRNAIEVSSRLAERMNQIRNPKSETRKKSEIRNPKEGRKKRKKRKKKRVPGGDCKTFFPDGFATAVSFPFSCVWRVSRALIPHSVHRLVPAKHAKERERRKERTTNKTRILGGDFKTGFSPMILPSMILPLSVGIDQTAGWKLGWQNH
jgi:hypothetical protein